MLDLKTPSIIKNKYDIDKSNKLISVDYSADNYNPKIFDIVEYKFNIKSNIKALQIKSITIFYNNQERNKVKYLII
jgi:hypothetical protein